MRKYFKGLLVLVLVLSVFTITGCGNNKDTKKKDNSSKTQEVKKKDMAGTYNLLEMNDGENKYTEEQIKSLEMSYVLEVKDDGTAILKYDDNEQKLVYDSEYFTNKDDENDKVKYTYKDKIITLDDGTVTMSFKKINK